MSSTSSAPAARLDALRARYGDGSDGASPTPAQWQQLLADPHAGPITLLNFFELRAQAHYAPGSGPDPAGTGGEAMMRYAAVSAPALEKVGGRFLLTAPFGQSLVGPSQDWDIVAIGAYPNREALLALFEDEAYAAAFTHRKAATRRQSVVVARG